MTSARRTTGTLVTRIRARAESAPDRPILRFLGATADRDESCLCYAEVDRRARAVAAQLQAAGANGERALLLHPPGLDYLVALLGCLYAGVIAVPVFPPSRRSLPRLRAIAADAQARFALTTAAAVDTAVRALGDGGFAGLDWLATDAVEADAGAWRPGFEQPDAPAVLQYTSGSTGMPRGVALSHANFLDNIAALAAFGAIGPADRIVSWLPPYHDMGLVSGLLLPLCTGAEATLMAPAAFLQRPLRWLAAISRYRGTVSGGPDFAFELCVRRIIAAEQRAQLDLGSWRIAFCGAERVRPATLERFAAAFAASGLRRSALTPCYGLAEATVGVSCATIGEAPHIVAFDEAALGQNRAQPPVAGAPAIRLAGCGRPLQGCEIRIVDTAERRTLPHDRIGEIWVRSPGVAAGYWNRTGDAQAPFHASLASGEAGDGRYLSTGDLGFLHDGELFVTGRIKDLIVLRGVNRYPDDFEDTLRACHPQLDAGAGVAFSVDVGDEERLVLVQEVGSARSAPLAAIADTIRRAVTEAHEVAVHDVVLVAPGTVPRTSSGKVQRGRCRELYLAQALKPLQSAAAAEPALPAASAERVAHVARLMADVLGVEAVHADDDFFWLGGHSLMATQLASRLCETFAIDLPLRAIFEAPTPRRLAARIQAAPATLQLPPVTLADRSQPLQLSFSQERMWLLHHLDPGSAAYNVAGAVTIDGPLDVEALRRSLAEIVRRREILRTRYPSLDGQPRMVIVEASEPELPLRDFAGCADADAAALDAASALAQQPFDIAGDFLMRAALYRIAPERHLLCVCMHHLITDAWSMGVFVGDLLRCYERFSRGETPPASGQRLSYIDYAQWQRRCLTREHLSAQRAYWLRQLQAAQPLELPGDRPRPPQRSSAGGFLPLPLPPELLDALAAMGTAQGTTLFMVMLGAFEVLLHRYTGSCDLVLGIPVANRNRLVTESLMGSLVNTLALRLRFDADVRFSELLRQVRETALDAYAHQDVPFELLIAELGVERRAGESPLINVMFDFQNAPVPGGAGGDLRMHPVMLSRGAAQFDLSLLIFDTELGRSAGVEYRSDLFDADTMQRLLGHYRCILEAIVVDPELPIARIPLLSRSESASLLAAAAGGAPVAPAEAVTTAFVEQARRRPQAPALFDDQGSLSYAQLERCSRRLAARLRAAGAGPGERVAVCLERDRRMAVALLATLRSGAAYVPLDPLFPTERIGYTLQDSAPRVLLTERRLRASLPVDGTVTCLYLDDIDALADEDDDTGRHAVADIPPDPVQAAYVIYTSGSTGRPKGVEVPAGALANFLASMRHSPGIGAGDRVLAVTTVAFDIAGLELWLPLTSGATLRLLPANQAADASALLAVMQQWRPTLMQATPATWKMLLDAGWPGDPQLTVLCGGEALAPELARALCRRSAAVWNMYGPTETTIWSALYRVRGDEAGRVPVGRPIDATRLYVLDRHGELQPQGIAGELYIGGAGVASGYFGRPELTAQRFLPDPFAANAANSANAVGDAPPRMYRTGDCVRLRGDGNFEYLSRLDDQIKLRGFRIEPGEIEALLREHPAIRDAVVVVRPRHGDAGAAAGEDDQRLVAYYVPAVGAAPIPRSELAEPLQRRLPAYMVPSAFVALPALPLTANGKIDRRALPAPVFEDAADDAGYLAPRDALEAELATLWAEVLALPRIGVRDDFFRRGGYSLLAMRLFARIEQQFGAALPLAALLERPTVEYLAERIRELRSRPAAVPALHDVDSRSFSHLVPIQTRGRRAPLFCVHGAGGNVLNFSRLAHYLGLARPLYGLQARGVDGRTAPFLSIEDMAAAYLQELRALQPQGPYYLGGYCGGGVIAFEMARRLRGEGETVALLALLDCYRPSLTFGVSRPRRWTYGIVHGGARYVRDKLVDRVRRDLRELSSWLRIGWARLRGQTVPFGLRDFWLTQHFLKSAQRYTPQPYPGKLTILRATEVDPELLGAGPELGWTGLASGGIQVFDVPGNHHSLMQEPNIGVLAATLGRCIEAAECGAAG